MRPAPESQPKHEPVLVDAVLRLLAPAPGQTLLDGTVGLGGHARALIPRIAPGGRYVGLDCDERMLAAARAALSKSEAPGVAVDLLHTSYAAFPEALAALGISKAHGMLLDLGVNSAQLADASRGFSLERDGPLDMRFDTRQKARAMDLVNALSERELADLLYEFGQESQSRRIAKRICQARRHARITSTRVLASLVESVAGPGAGRSRIHPATRVFQALRITINHELDSLRDFLARAFDALAPGGRLAIISFHSLEDGLVKREFRAARQAGLIEELTRQPVIAEPDERTRNPRSRSAKLRCAQRI
jgi:16S rRNA (cytosine1402-N4)-methyltransferase